MSHTDREQELLDELEQVRRLLHEERRSFIEELAGSADTVEGARARLERVTEQRDRARARADRLVEQCDALEAEVADSLYRESRAVRLASRVVRRVRRS